MRRTTSLTTAFLAGLTPVLVLLAAPSATGAGETCRGEAATIVGADRRDIVGTEGRDVVVTNLSQDVKTLGGDDLVCVTGPDKSGGGYRPVTVDAGSGDDVVDGTAASSWPVHGTLGTGSDRFEGGGGRDTVRAGAPSPDFRDQLDTEHDVLLGGGGQDHLVTGQAGVVGSDIVDGGADDDGIAIIGLVTDAASLDGGDGRDHIGLQLAAGQNVLTNALPGDTGELRHGAVPVARWTDLEIFYVRDPEAGTPSVAITGGADEESFSLAGTGRTVADLGAGDDSLSARQVLPADSSVAGGAGSDWFSTGTETHDLAWDLADGVLRVGESWALPVTAVENAFVAAPKVQLWGSGDDNRLVAVSCDVELRGRGGDDTLALSGDSEWETYDGCARKTLMVGGAGDDELGSRAGAVDRMVGGSGNDAFDAKGGRDTILGGPGRDSARAGNDADRFVGGPGKDRVDGEQGRDRCVAEREKNCERG